MKDPHPVQPFSAIYTERAYGKRDGNWHLADAPGKTRDLCPAGRRETWGFVSFFNCRSFAAMAAATGWKPMLERLLPPWELIDFAGKKLLLPGLMVKMNRTIASFLIDSFYLIGAYRPA